MQTTDWNRFIYQFGRTWRQGEDISIIGPKGSGKSFLALELIKTREYAILFLTKGKDSTLTSFIQKNNYEETAKWPPSGTENHIALWPKFKGVDSFETQENIFRTAINGKRGTDGIFAEGGWSILIDEVMYFREQLHLEPELRMLWTQGRSNDLSLVAGSQRPRDVPQLMLSQWTHFFCFQTSDKYEIERLAAIGGNISNVIKEEVPKLRPHHFLYINRTKPELNCISVARR